MALVIALAGAPTMGVSKSRETIKVHQSMLTEQPSIALKHLSLENVALGVSTIEVELKCNVWRQTGQLDCSRARREAAGDEFVIAAIRRSRAMRLDIAQLDPDSSAPLRTILTVVLAGGDRRPIDFLSAPRLQMGDVQWAQMPSVAEIEAMYPQDLLKQGLTASVNLVCQIQSDLSLLCVTNDPAPAGDGKELEAYRKFSWAGQAIMTLYTAAPTLKSGARSAGSVVATKVDFKPLD